MTADEAAERFPDGAERVEGSKELRVVNPNAPGHGQTLG
jgi:hypothetical protein